MHNGEITGGFGLKWLREASHDEKDYLIHQHDQRKGSFGVATIAGQYYFRNQPCSRSKNSIRKIPKFRHITGHPAPFGPDGNFKTISVGTSES
jgi:hypothetical protein